MPALPFVRYRALKMAEELFLHIAKMRTALGSPQGVPVGSQVTCVHLLAYMALVHPGLQEDISHPPVRQNYREESPILHCVWEESTG